jgi:hypothetical protein
MKPGDYIKQYLSEFPPPDQFIHDLANEYHERCEAYDRTVCSGPIGPEGGILRGTPRERGLINRNAYAVRKELLRRAVDKGRTGEELDRAIREWRPAERRT